MKRTANPCPAPLSVRTLTRMARVLKLLAHPCRLRIVDILDTEATAPVHTLTERLGLSQTATSGHLKKMRRLGLVACKRRGQEVWYSLGDRRSLTILKCMRSKEGAPL